MNNKETRKESTDKKDVKNEDKSPENNKKTINHKAKQTNNHSKTNNLKVFYIIAIILIVVASSFIVYHRLNSQTIDYSYNGFSFTKNGQYWMTQVERNGQLFEAPFYIHPSEVPKRKKTRLIDYKRICKNWFTMYPNKKVLPSQPKYEDAKDYLLWLSQANELNK